MYLKVHPNLLFRSLHVHLNYIIKKKKERQFLHHRLQLFDEQCRLDHQKELWQSYFILGSEQQLWPVSFHSLFIVNNILKKSFFLERFFKKHVYQKSKNK